MSLKDFKFKREPTRWLGLAVQAARRDTSGLPQLRAAAHLARPNKPHDASAQVQIEEAHVQSK